MSLTSCSRWRPEISTLPTYGRCLSLSVAEDLLLQQLGEPDDRVQRRAQLVAHVGEERALGLVGGVGQLLGVDRISRCARSRSVDLQLQPLVGLASAGWCASRRATRAPRAPGRSPCSTRLRSMNWPICPPSALSIDRWSSLAWRTSLLKKAMTPMTSGPLRSGMANGAVQRPTSAAQLGQRQRRLLGEVGDPQRQVALPDPARQTLVGRACAARAAPVEVVRLREVVGVPDVDAAQELLALVDLPQLADLPALVLAHDAQDHRRRLAQAVRAGQHARDHVLQRQQALGALALGDLALQRQPAGVDRRLLARRPAACRPACSCRSPAISDEVLDGHQPDVGAPTTQRADRATPYSDWGQKKVPARGRRSDGAGQQAATRRRGTVARKAQRHEGA